MQFYGCLSILYDCLSLSLGWKHLFQSCGHCWVFQICWPIKCSTFTASSFRIWKSSTGIPSPPLPYILIKMVFINHLPSRNGINILGLKITVLKGCPSDLLVILLKNKTMFHFLQMLIYKFWVVIWGYVIEIVIIYLFLLFQINIPITSPRSQLKTYKLESVGNNEGLPWWLSW